MVDRANNDNWMLAGMKYIIVIGGDILVSREYSNSRVKDFSFYVVNIKENLFNEFFLLFNSKKAILK